MSAISVNLDRYRTGSSRVYAGRDRGRYARIDANLDQYDKEEVNVEVIVPENVRSVNSSFFLGMFEESIKNLGEEGFRRKYKFRGPHMDEVVEYGVKAALNKSSPLLP